MAIFPFRKSNSQYSYVKLTLYIIIINVGIYLLTLISPTILGYLAITPALTIDHQMFWQPFTYMFVHNIPSPMHLIFNMLWLFFVGFEVERQMGSKQFGIFYAIAGIGSGLLSLLSYVIVGAWGIHLYGASGVVFAVLIAFACFFPYAKIYVFGIFPVRAPWLVVGYAGIEAIFTLTSGVVGDGIAHITHLFGAIIGYFYMVLRFRLDLVKLILKRD